jgi:hypothetical protein
MPPQVFGKGKANTRNFSTETPYSNRSRFHYLLPLSLPPPADGNAILLFGVINNNNNNIPLRADFITAQESESLSFLFFPSSYS